MRKFLLDLPVLVLRVSSAAFSFSYARALFLRWDNVIANGNLLQAANYLASQS